MTTYRVLLFGYIDMTGWEIGIGFYTGIMMGFWSDRFENGYKHAIYLPFIFIELNTYYD